jgi:hypothetical protein
MGNVYMAKMKDNSIMATNKLKQHTLDQGIQSLFLDKKVKKD